MSSNDDFLNGLKSAQDRDKEWTDAAEYFVKLRHEPAEEIQPLPEVQKEASAADKAKTIWNVAKRLDPTGIAPVASKSLAGLGTVLGGAALMGGGAALMNRGKKELKGKSQLEHDLQQGKKMRHEGPEPKSFVRKVLGNFQDLNADLASTARKHPGKSSAFAALGGAAAAAKIFRGLNGKGK